MILTALASMAALAGVTPRTQDWVTYEGGPGPGRGRHIVLLAGDEEYRSEEAMPQLARILSKRHGFRCTVVFSINPKGEIDPETRNHQPGLEALAKADLCILLIRFREWPDEQMRHFVDYYRAGKPFIALRTSTHAFAYPAGSTSPYRDFDWQSRSWPGGFGKQVLGETWVSHWGNHGSQATRGVLVKAASSHPVLRGVEGLFGDTDVYEAHPPADAQVLVLGQVVEGMKPDAPPAQGAKKTATGFEQKINDPMMPIAWVRHRKNEAGATNRILTTTMGAATDLLDEGFRRLLVNGALWAVGLERKITSSLNVDFVGTYEPSRFGFGGYRKGVRPSDLK